MATATATAITIFGEPLRYRAQQFVGNSGLVDKFLLARWNIWSILRCQSTWFALVPGDIIRLIARYYFPWRLEIDPYIGSASVIRGATSVISYFQRLLKLDAGKLELAVSSTKIDDDLMRYADHPLYAGMCTLDQQHTYFQQLATAKHVDYRVQSTPFCNKYLNAYVVFSMVCQDDLCQLIVGNKANYLEISSARTNNISLTYHAHIKRFVFIRYLVETAIHVEELKLLCDELLIGLLLNYVVILRKLDEIVAFIHMIRCDANGLKVVHIFRVDNLLHCCVNETSLFCICKGDVYVLDSEHLF